MPLHADLDVYLHGQHAGTIVTGDNAPTLRYAYSYLSSRTNAGPLSLSMPLSVDSMPAEAWLDGLLPDNVSVRRRWAHRQRVRSSSPSSLLSTPIGLDCAGAVQFTPAGTPLPADRHSGVDWVSETEMAEWVARVRADWNDWDGPRGIGQFSLAGAQAKCAVRLDDGRCGVPFGAAPTSHILKPGIDRFPGADLAEHLSLEAARFLGLDASSSQVILFGGLRVLAVRRWDRVAAGDGLRRLHQEDLCQSLGIVPELKYQVLGGPSPAAIAQHLRAHALDPLGDVQHFADAVVYNWIIGAPDAHAKNFAMILDGHHARLAPLYDVISFIPFSPHPIEDTRMAMSVDGESTFGDADCPDYWDGFAQSVGLPSGRLLERIGDMTHRVPAAMQAAAKGLSAEDAGRRIVASLVRGVSDRCENLAGRFPDTTATRSASLASGTWAAVSAGRAVLCEQPTKGGTCRRRLLSGPCPLHPDSPGSQAVLARRIAPGGAVAVCSVDAGGC
ncbi:HipA domain-containing protein [Candidatus Poriferisodalis sp.]|uniref:HipA domain-containing protein n=1 Tax=Candidatus Poriferisodalis sp. TaxID=3101277 RepID=UPI003B02AAEB